MSDAIITQCTVLIDGTLEHLESGLQSIRTGRAHPSMVESVIVDAYGVKTPLNQLANVSAPDALSLVVEPWDKSILPLLEKSIRDSDLGLSPINEGERIRLKLPQLTEERRKEIAKVVSERVEEAKIAVRNHREETLKALKRAEMSEDEEERLKGEIQKLVDESNEKIVALGAAKTTEVLNLNS